VTEEPSVPNVRGHDPVSSYLSAFSLEHVASADQAVPKAFELMNEPHIQGAIADHRKRVFANDPVDQDWVRFQLRRVYNRSMADEPVMLPDGTPTGVYRNNSRAALRALELLGKDLGMFTEKVDLNASSDNLSELVSLFNSMRGGRK
jgi:hypothetical protein